jgi:hypothetical protein
MKHQRPVATNTRFSCGYLTQPKMRYYSLDGTEMPCCFIKDTSVYEGLDGLQAHQQAGTWPKACVGCRYADKVAYSVSSGREVGLS